jgi:nucleoside-diphosphate-sugar epimerase
MTILEFAQHVLAAVDRDLPIHYEPLPQDDPKRRRPDITKARQLLGWQPEVSLEEGMKETIEHFRSRVAVF